MMVPSLRRAWQWRNQRTASATAGESAPMSLGAKSLIGRCQAHVLEITYPYSSSSIYNKRAREEAMFDRVCCRAVGFPECDIISLILTSSLQYVVHLISGHLNVLTSELGRLKVRPQLIIVVETKDILGVLRGRAGCQRSDGCLP